MASEEAGSGDDMSEEDNQVDRDDDPYLALLMQPAALTVVPQDGRLAEVDDGADLDLSPRRARGGGVAVSRKRKQARAAGFESHTPPLAAGE